MAIGGEFCKRQTTLRRCGRASVAEWRDLLWTYTVGRLSQTRYNLITGLEVVGRSVRITTVECFDTGAYTIAFLSEDFEMQDIDASDRYWAVHRRLERSGTIAHTADSCPERDAALEMRSWTPESQWTASPVLFEPTYGSDGAADGR